MKTTPPRTLVHSLNVFLNRFRKRIDNVQQKIDELPPMPEQSHECDPTENMDPTESDHDGDALEEIKCEEDDPLTGIKAKPLNADPRLPPDVTIKNEPGITIEDEHVVDKIEQQKFKPWCAFPVKRLQPDAPDADQQP